MKKQVFIINGSGGTGKDTFVAFVSEQFNGGVINYSSVDVIKQIARFIGWDGSKTEKDRKFLSDLKHICTEYNDLPLYCMIQELKKFALSDDKIFFLHIREPKEIEKVKNTIPNIGDLDIKTILLTRDSVKHITTNDADKNVFDYDYDVEIQNDEGLDELKTKAKQFLEDYCKDELKSIY